MKLGNFVPKPDSFYICLGRGGSGAAAQSILHARLLMGAGGAGDLALPGGCHLFPVG